MEFVAKTGFLLALGLFIWIQAALHVPRMEWLLLLPWAIFAAAYWFTYIVVPFICKRPHQRVGGTNASDQQRNPC